MDERNMDLSKYEAIRNKFKTVEVRCSKSKVGRRKVRVVSRPSMDEFLRMENTIRKPIKE